MPGDLDTGERIARGVQCLIKGCPLWWDNRHGQGLNPLMLDFTDPRHDLLAAIYGTREAGLKLLGIPPGDAADYGLAARDEADNAALRRLWAVWVDTNRADAMSRPQPLFEPAAPTRWSTHRVRVAAAGPKFPVRCWRPATTPA